MNKVTKGIVIAIIVIVLIILAPIVLIFTTVEGATYYNKAKDYIAGKTYAKPIVNPHPTQFLTVTGDIASGVRVQLSIDYGTHNPKCDITTNWLEGVSGPKGHTLYYDVTPDSQGHYKTQIPLDALKPGICRWRSEAIYYQVFSTNSNIKSPPRGAAVFFRNKDKQNVPYHIIVECRKIGDKAYPLVCSSGYPKGFNGLHLKTSHEFTIDFRHWSNK